MKKNPNPALTMELEYVIDGSSKPWFNMRELWRYKELFYFFTWRDIKIKYKQTVLGFLWAIIQPLFMMLIFTFFFGKSLDIATGGIAYPVFVFSGLLTWNIFANGLVSSSNSMVNNSMIIKKIYFPKIIIVTTSVLGSLFDFLMAFIIFIPLLFFYDSLPALSALWCWPLAIAMVSVATIGPGSFVAALNVKYRDFRYVIPFAVQLLFFISPIIYPVSMLSSEWMKYLVALSPVYAPIELFRMPIGGTLPSTELMTISLCSALTFFCVGLAYFRANEDSFADVV